MLAGKIAYEGHKRPATMHHTITISKLTSYMIKKDVAAGETDIKVSAIRQ